MPIDWVSLLSEPRGKLQGFWSGRLREHAKDALLRSLPEDDCVDLRSSGGPGSGGFLEPPSPWDDEEPASMPERHFLLMLRDRLRMALCAPGSRCQHRRRDGRLCGELLDARGRHALKCECGPTRDGRHNGLRDVAARLHAKITGYVA